MTRPFTDSERTLMVRLHQKNRTLIAPNEETPAIDALWLGRSAAGSVYLRAYLQTVGLPLETGSLLAWAVNPGRSGRRRLRRIPLEEVVWLFHAPNPPASQARLLDPEPLLTLPGEAEATRLRRMVGADATSIVPPTDLIDRLPGGRIEAVEADPEPNSLCYGWRREGSGVVFLVQERAGPDQDSAALSLAAWLCGYGEGMRTWDMGCVSATERNATSQGLPLLRTWGALRLPMPRLFLEYRATPLTRHRFVSSFAHENGLPTRLVYRRLALLLRAERDGIIVF